MLWARTGKVKLAAAMMFDLVGFALYPAAAARVLTSTTIGNCSNVDTCSKRHAKHSLSS